MPLFLPDGSQPKRRNTAGAFPGCISSLPLQPAATEVQDPHAYDFM